MTHSTAPIMQVLTVKRDRDERGWPMWKVYSDELGYVGEVCADTEADAIEAAYIEIELS